MPITRKPSTPRERFNPSEHSSPRAEEASPPQNVRLVQYHPQRGGPVRAADLAGVHRDVLLGEMAHEEPGPDQQEQKEGHRKGGGHPAEVSSESKVLSVPTKSQPRGNLLRGLAI